ncbi:MAG: sulfotransferase [Verrucomicrobiae bacterium]|nr:sulfotransferase [Verrucomicrobiae bacterium]
MDMPADPLGELAAELACRPAPVVVFNKSHSGSRFLAQLLQEGGVFMGAHLNESRDSLDVLRLVEHVVERHYPDFGALWCGDGAAAREVVRIARETFASHLDGLPPESDRPWGWKLCETGYILPVIDRLFPKARYVHLIRDGRDVAFCNHRGPDSPFWRKIYFNTDRIRTWGGRRCTAPEYRRRPHVYNALHWANSVMVGRAFGSMLRERYLEIRYEDLCADFASAAPRVLRFAGIANPGPAIARLASVAKTSSIGKFQRATPAQMDEILAIAKPALLSLGYLREDPAQPARPSRRGWLGRLFTPMR